MTGVPTGIRIVPMAPEHCAAVHAIEVQCFSQPWSKAALRAETQKGGSEFFVALIACGKSCESGDAAHDSNDGAAMQNDLARPVDSSDTETGGGIGSADDSDGEIFVKDSGAVSAGSGGSKPAAPVDAGFHDGAGKTAARSASGIQETCGSTTAREVVAGYAGVQCVLDEGYITNVAVDTAFRGRGIATRLLTALDEMARARGLTFLTLEVRASNQAAIALYETCGYQKAGVRRGFYTKPREDAILYTKHYN